MLYTLQSIERPMTSESIMQTGRCACGKVTFSVLAPKSYGACHCRMCRRWCGGLWMGVACDEVHDLSGNINHWKSSRIASRGTCAHCGSSIWYKLRNTEKYVFGQGLFDDQSDWTFTRELCCDGKPDHYSLADTGQKAFTGWGTLWAALLGKLPK